MSDDIAVIGLAGRFPGAPDVDRFWANLRDGVDAVVRFERDEMAADGVTADLLDDPAYVPARGFLADGDRFDARLFGYTPREAELLDPQQRLLLECACAALEGAAHGAQNGERVGVYVGTSLSSYLLAMVRSAALRPRLDPLTMIAAERDCAATRIAYKLNLTGPAVTVQSACSTSLVAVHLAAAALRAGECDTAIAGGASLTVPRRSGYRYEEGGAFSPDGRSRPFDQAAAGTVPGDGAGVAVLRRLADALADRDPILAVVKGSAINNDGAAKVGYTAPSVDGQLAVIRAAHRAAGVEADTIGYVEAHGTATRVGDPIEIAALTEAFRANAGARRDRCVVGSVKSGIGHLDAAAGIAGFIKTVLQLRHRQLVPTVNFEAPNPLLELDRTPFRIADRLEEWAPGDEPRRAGVSAFGVGGTNAHVVLEEYAAPAVPVRAEQTERPAREQLVVLSAGTAEACDESRERLRAFAAGQPDTSAGTPSATLADVAYSSAVGRAQRPYRWFAVADSDTDLIDRLGRDGGVGKVPPIAPRTVFVFPGAGAAYQGMAAGLYETEPVFAEAIDRCAHAGIRLSNGEAVDPRRLLRRTEPDPDLLRPEHALPSLFAVEYALTRLLDSWGVRPDGMIGHSMGEYAAACAAGVLDVQDALALLALRGELASRVSGTMLIVEAAEADVRPLLGPDVALAAVNAPDLCVASGTIDAVQSLAARLTERDVQHRMLEVGGPGHSHLLDPILPEYAAACAKVPWAPPRIPFVSNVTGTWITDAEATDPGYWTRQFRSTVRYADGLAVLAERQSVVWMVGAGRSYVGWARRQFGAAGGHLLLSCLPGPDRATEDRRELLTALGRHWSAGGAANLADLHAASTPRRVALPAYPFQRERYWALPGAEGANARRARDEDGGGLAEPQAEPTGYPRPDIGVEYTAPRDEQERELAAVWADLFGVDRVGVHDDFFELGGDSLLAVRLAARARERLGATVLAGAVVRARTIARLGEMIADAASDPVAAATRDRGGDQPEQPNLAGAARESRARVKALLGAAPAGRGRPGERAVLVGATGHLGPYLLSELAAQRDLPITVLVRGRDAEHAYTRVRTALEARSLWTPSLDRRVEVVPADLREHHLGLADDAWRALAAQAAVVYHGGAEVNFLRPYDRLAPANVLGTERVLELAAAAGGVRVHHVSSLGVLFDDDPGQAPLAEEPLGPHPGALPTGYLQSKWVAEHAVSEARRHGLDTVIYRVCAVAGDSATGYCNVDDLFWRVVHTCMLTGLAPRSDGGVLTASVDVVARALIALSTRDGAEVVHLVPPETPWSTVWTWLRDLGWRIEEVPRAEWERDVRRRVLGGGVPDGSAPPGDDSADPLPLAPLASALPRLLPGRQPRFDGAVAAGLLREAGAALPAPDFPAFADSVDYLLTVGRRGGGPQRTEYHR